MAGRFVHAFGVALLAVAAAACGTSAPSRFYTLASTATADGATVVRAGVMVGPVSVPASVDRSEFVVQVAPNRVEIDEFNRWAAPLGESIARTVAGDLSTLLGTPDVATAPFANFDPDYRVTIDVQRFDSVQGQSVKIAAGKDGKLYSIAHGKLHSLRCRRAGALCKYSCQNRYQCDG